LSGLQASGRSARSQASHTSASLQCSPWAVSLPACSALLLLRLTSFPARPAACVERLSHAADMRTVLDWLIAHSLGDLSDDVWEQSLAVGVSLVQTHGAAHATDFMPVLDGFLESQTERVIVAVARGGGR
jgi:hypothetical protein